MGNSKIEWTDKSWNPISGCTKLSTGCKNCYAEKLWPRLNAPGQPYEGRLFTDIKCHPDRLLHPMSWRTPAKIFVNSMSDLFHEDVPDQFILDVFNVIRRCHITDRGHIFQILTKRPERMADFCSRLRFNGLANDGKGRLWLCYDPADRSAYSLMPQHGCTGLTNLWMGVSVENQETANERIPHLLKTPAHVRWLSVEPLIGEINLNQWLENKAINWCVVGGESGHKARPMHPVWALSIKNQCKKHNVPFLFKQWGTFKPIANYYSESLNDDTLAGADIYPLHIVNRDGDFWRTEFDGQPPASCVIMKKTSKKKSGRTLDGEIYNEYPESSQ